MEDLFGGAAPYYATHRHHHGADAIAHLGAALGPERRVLDLGCGPGTVAIPLSAYVREVIAVDPDEEMLAEGRRRSPANVRWIRSDSSRVRELPAFDDAVMGRSFHWMDRTAVLNDFDALIPSDGAVCLVGPCRDPATPSWEPVTATVRAQFGLQWRPTAQSFEGSGLHHDEVIGRSAFSEVETTLFDWVLVRDVDDVVGLQLSYSYSAPARLGDRVAAFTAALRAALLEDCPDGMWEEHITTEVLIARRPR
ncbi:class I SAM-dependent methyltransferase [Nonomuraea sp. NPDC050556]|uniref:class I SAM-dependent methyltransferase n=1 Tax=Nonomuraea sp. NPDC050556 TaxID=3364369 RepID=UPI0037A0613D